MKNPQWLQWAQRLQAIAQNGLAYVKDPFDLERFNQIRQIAAEILSSSDDPNTTDSVIDLFKRNFGYATPKVDVREESGYEAKAEKLAAVYDHNLHDHPPYPFHSYKLFFLCTLTGGAPQLSLETTAVDFFAENNIPPLSLPRVTPIQI